MNFPATSGGGDDPSPPRKELTLQGPRPTALKIQKDSYKIKKPPLPSKLGRDIITDLTRTASQQPPQDLRRDPVIIYAVSPKIIHADESEFMRLVQYLTGPSLSTDDISAGGGGDVSPAARLAAVERVSPRVSPRERIVEEVEVSRNPGILSPAPESFPAEMYAGFFSPAASEINDQFPSLSYSPVFQEMRFVSSPNSYWLNNSTSFLASPSPTLPYDIFDHNF